MANQYIGNDNYKSDFDSRVYQPQKRHWCNPVGEDIHILTDGSLVRDEDAIVRAQRIFKHNYYKPEGRGCRKAIERLVENVSGPAQPPPISK
jgi:hypothetical protein